ncbi:hypothetical protein JHK84_027552 [Glycine max]|nr:hypothetical protein JHK85_027949 [Glycine max]KAG5003298.1 hypothetical protein JHK86_027437 [Glycine max]KAG5151080.1 hypothetical protein JHK84_027552 [Glycine max]
MFVIALVTNEIEEIYVWLLEQFLKAMKETHPSSVITDGDLNSHYIGRYATLVKLSRHAIHYAYRLDHYEHLVDLLSEALNQVKQDNNVQHGKHANKTSGGSHHYDVQDPSVIRFKGRGQTTNKDSYRPQRMQICHNCG